MNMIKIKIFLVYLNIIVLFFFLGMIRSRMEPYIERARYRRAERRAERRPREPAPEGPAAAEISALIEEAKMITREATE